MRTVGKILAGLCAVLFVFTGVLALLLFNIERKAFTAGTYKKAFENQKLYDRMPGILASALESSIKQNASSAEYLKAINAQDWESIIASLVPPEEIKSMTDGALESTFDYLNGKATSAAISLLPFKRHMVSPAGVDAVMEFLRSQPDCSLDQIAQMTLALFGESKLLICNPPKEAMGLITPLIESQLQLMTITFPDEITIIDGNKSGTPEDPRLKIDQARAILKLTPLLPLLFLLGITVFIVRSLVGWLKWWGWPFLLTGIIGLLIALPGSSLVGFFIERGLQNQGTDSLPPILFSSMRETAGAVTRQILKPVTIEGLILAILGLAMIVIAVLIAKGEQNQIIDRLETDTKNPKSN